MYFLNQVLTTNNVINTRDFLPNFKQCWLIPSFYSLWLLHESLCSSQWFDVGGRLAEFLSGKLFKVLLQLWLIDASVEGYRETPRFEASFRGIIAAITLPYPKPCQVWEAAVQSLQFVPSQRTPSVLGFNPVLHHNHLLFTVFFQIFVFLPLVVFIVMRANYRYCTHIGRRQQNLQKSFLCIIVLGSFLDHIFCVWLVFTLVFVHKNNTTTTGDFIQS